MKIKIEGEFTGTITDFDPEALKPEAPESESPLGVVIRAMHDAVVPKPPELKPCVYCASMHFEDRASGLPGEDSQMECMTCGAMGPVKTTEAEARAALSTRPIEDELRTKITRLKHEMEMDKLTLDELGEKYHNKRTENEQLKKKLSLYSMQKKPRC